MLRCVWSALNPLSIHVTCTATVPGEAKMCKNVLKWRMFELVGWITGKRLKIDGYMLRSFWQDIVSQIRLDWIGFDWISLSIHVTFTVIVQEAYPGRPKCVNVLKWHTFELRVELGLLGNGWRQMGTCCDVFDKHWILFSSMSIYHDSPIGVLHGRTKCAVDSLDVAKCLHPQSAKVNNIPAWLSWGSQIMCLRLIAETGAHSVDDSNRSCLNC